MPIFSDDEEKEEKEEKSGDESDSDSDGWHDVVSPREQKIARRRRKKEKETEKEQEVLERRQRRVEETPARKPTTKSKDDWSGTYDVGAFQKSLEEEDQREAEMAAKREAEAAALEEKERRERREKRKMKKKRRRKREKALAEEAKRKMLAAQGRGTSNVDNVHTVADGASNPGDTQFRRGEHEGETVAKAQPVDDFSERTARRRVRKKASGMGNNGNGAVDADAATDSDSDSDDDNDDDYDSGCCGCCDSCCEEDCGCGPRFCGCCPSWRTLCCWCLCIYRPASACYKFRHRWAFVMGIFSLIIGAVIFSQPALSNLTFIFKDGTTMPLLALQLGYLSPEKVPVIMGKAFGEGFRHFYVPSLSPEREVAVGDALAEEFGSMTGFQRHDVFVTSTLSHSTRGGEGTELEAVEETCRRTLENLGLDHVDLYLMDWPMAFDGDSYSGVHFIDTWKAMENLVDLGLANHIGVANVNSSQLSQILKASRIRPAVLETEIHPYLPEESLTRHARAKGMAVLARSFLGRTMPKDPYSPDPLLLHEGIADMAEKKWVKPAQILAKFILQRSFGLVARVGSQMTTVDYADLVGWRLTSEEMRRLSILKKFKWRSPVTNHVRGHPHFPYAKEDLNFRFSKEAAQKRNDPDLVGRELPNYDEIMEMVKQQLD
eukprot:g3912.t1